MTLKKALEVLHKHQQWRLGNDDIPITVPKELTQALDTVLNYHQSTKELEDFLQWIEEETFFKHGTTRFTAQPNKLFTHKELVELYNQEKL
jgi:hypothetical protein